MKRRVQSLVLFTFLTLCPFAIPLCAQTIEPTAKTVAPPKYDISREVTLTATVSSVVSQATSEKKMLAGSHLILETASGKIDVSLGDFPLTVEGAPSVSAGQRVQVTGVLKTVRDQRVLMARLALINGRTYKVRNAHGFLLMPAANKETAEAKGGRL